jgi:hypothetical protein
MFLCRPEPVTIAVCDAVHLDPTTRRKTLAGVYPHVVAESFPHAMPTVWLYVPFTGAQGIVEFSVRVLDGDAALFAVSFRGTCGDLRSTYDLRVPVNVLTFPRPGTYLIEALAGGVAFARRELLVIAREPATAYPAALAPSAS